MIAFANEPAIGTLLKLDEQVYELSGSVPHQRKDGTWTKLLVWETACPACGASFEVRTATRSSSTPNRRCAQCRKTGKPVKGKRGRRVKVEVVTP